MKKKSAKTTTAHQDVIKAIRLLESATNKISMSHDPCVCVAQGRIEGPIDSLVIAAELLEISGL